MYIHVVYSEYRNFKCIWLSFFAIRIFPRHVKRKDLKTHRANLFHFWKYVYIYNVTEFD